MATREDAHIETTQAGNPETGEQRFAVNLGALVQEETLVQEEINKAQEGA